MTWENEGEQLQDIRPTDGQSFFHWTIPFETGARSLKAGARPLLP
jgi:hypothetical protein